MIPQVPPAVGKTAFACPYCTAYSRQLFLPLYYQSPTGGFAAIKSYIASQCDHCGKIALWNETKLVVPDITPVSQPNQDLTEEIQADYREAASIVVKSPRGAAALLRLCLQKLCVQLGQAGKNINDDIGNLVKQGLPVQIQQSLDVLRVVGNNAVHPGELDIKDDQTTALAMFVLINLIAQVMITNRKQIDQLYKSLPSGALNAITKRDNPPGV